MKVLPKMTEPRRKMQINPPKRKRGRKPTRPKPSLDEFPKLNLNEVRKLFIALKHVPFAKNMTRKMMKFVIFQLRKQYDPQTLNLILRQLDIFIPVETQQVLWDGF
jgi:hypothetical protein